MEISAKVRRVGAGLGLTAVLAGAAGLALAGTAAAAPAPVKPAATAKIDFAIDPASVTAGVKAVVVKSADGKTTLGVFPLHTNGTVTDVVLTIPVNTKTDVLPSLTADGKTPATDTLGIELALPNHPVAADGNQVKVKYGNKTLPTTVSESDSLAKNGATVVVLK